MSFQDFNLNVLGRGINPSIPDWPWRHLRLSSWVFYYYLKLLLSYRINQHFSVVTGTWGQTVPCFLGLFCTFQGTWYLWPPLTQCQDAPRSMWQPKLTPCMANLGHLFLSWVNDEIIVDSPSLTCFSMMIIYPSSPGTVPGTPGVQMYLLLTPTFTLRSILVWMINGYPQA